MLIKKIQNNIQSKVSFASKKQKFFEKNSEQQKFTKKIQGAQKALTFGNHSQGDYLKNMLFSCLYKTFDDFKDKKIAFLPAGSFITGVNFDPEWSDYDTTILTENDSYPKMEALICDVRESVGDKALYHLEKDGYGRKEKKHILSVINLYATPKVKDVYPSYKEFIKYTNLKISLGEDHDTGVWLPGVLQEHFLKEGNLIYRDEQGQPKQIRIKDNIEFFYKFAEDNNIEVPKTQIFYTSDKLKLISEFTDALENKFNRNARNARKYYLRVKKFLKIPSVNDLYEISKDDRKNTNPKFNKLFNEEELFYKQIQKIEQIFSIDINEININDKGLLKDLQKLRKVSSKIVSRSLLRGF